MKGGFGRPGPAAPEKRHAEPASLAQPTAWAVLCDFDGTITLDVTDSILLRFGRPGWEALEREWREGRIGSRQCMAGQIALVDCSREELDEHLGAIAIDPDFAGFAAHLRQSGVPLCIVSDGLDVAITSILRRHGIDGIPVHASRLVQTGPRSWVLEFPQARSGCDSATCKCAMGRPHRGASRVLLIGDGDSDACAAGQADMVFARKRLLAHCRALGLPHRRADDFAQVIDDWRCLIAAPPAGAAMVAPEKLDV